MVSQKNYKSSGTRYRNLNRRFVRIKSRFLFYFLIVLVIFLVLLLIVLSLRRNQEVNNYNILNVPSDLILGLPFSRAIDSHDYLVEANLAAVISNPGDNDIRTQPEVMPRKSCAGALKSKGFSLEVGDLPTRDSFNSTPGWNGPIKYEWKSNQVYPFKFSEGLVKLISSEDLREEMEAHDSTGGQRTEIQELLDEACNSPKPTLIGKFLGKNFAAKMTMDQVAQENTEVQVGGEWAPVPTGEDEQLRRLSPSCPKIAIIILCKDGSSWENLKILLHTLHPFLQRQQNEYQIFVAEQFGTNALNLGSLSNAAFVVAMSLAKFDCIIFHDVNLIPAHDYNLYNCEESPRHFAVAVDNFKYKLPYAEYLGGVLGFTPEHFLLLNGYSNSYTDSFGVVDDLYYRTQVFNLNVTRPSNDISTYKLLLHEYEKQTENEQTCQLLKTSKVRYPIDGLTNLEFRLLSLNYELLYTHLLIDLGIQ